MFYTKAAVIASLYVALTMIFSGWSFGNIQFRISEALTILPFVMPEAIPGLFVGCVAANMMTPNNVPLDMAVGSLSTLLAAALTFRTRSRYAAPIPPIAVNAVTIPFVIALSSAPGGGGFWSIYIFNALTVAAGQFAVCYVLGLLLLTALEKTGVLAKIKSIK